MENFLKSKRFFYILTLILLAGFLVLPKICLADDFENITSEELSKYLELPEKDANKLMDTLRQVFTTEGILAWSSGDTTEEKIAVAVTLLKVVEMQALSHLLIDAPIEIIKGIVKTAVEISKIVLIKDISDVLDRIEKETVQIAVNYGMDFLLQNEIKVTPGAIKFRYPSYKGGEREITFQYVMIYKSENNPKRAKVEIRFYMPDSIEAPDAQKFGWVSSLYVPDLRKDLLPFIVDINGMVEKDEFGNYRWINEKGETSHPSVNITFPDNVPDLGIKPLSWWEKYLLKPIETTIKDIDIIITKVTGRSLGLVEVWEEIKSFILKITNLSPAAIVETPVTEEKEQLEQVPIESPELKLEEKTTPIEVKQVEENFDTGGLFTLDEIQEILDDIAERIDVISVDVAKLTGKEIISGEEKTLAKEEIEESEIEEPEEELEKLSEQKLCEKNSWSYPLRNKLIINEAAWMGSTNSANDEWIELKNISGQELNLAGWQLLDKDTQIKIVFSDNNRVSANGFYLLERTSDDSVIDIRADLIYSGALSNTYEALYLFNENCQLQDEVIANPDWPAGDNSSKRTMERKSDFGWQTSLSPGGTPKRDNSSGYIETSSYASGGGSTPSPSPQFFPVVINEIMYDLEGNDAGREWIEIFNTAESSVDLTGWKFYENETNHNLKLVQGTISIPSNGYAIIADDTEKFLMDHPDYSGTLFDTAFSLSNSGEKIAIKNGDLITNEVTYESAWRANGDGNSLQKFDNQWLTAPPTPGSENKLPPPILEVSTTTLSFEAIEDVKVPASQSLIIQNSGGSNLNWQISPPESWLNFDPSEGSISPYSSSTIEVSININELAAGNYSATFNIEAAGAQNSPKQIFVNLIIYKKRFAQNVVISEVQIADNEFVELYNPTDKDINMCPDEENCWYFSYFSATRDEEGNPKYNWNNPYRNKKFSEAPITIIPTKGYFLIGLKGYSEENVNPNSNWQVYQSDQLGNTAGSVGIFSCNPKNSEENPITVEDAKNCKVDLVGWDKNNEISIKEGDSVSPPPAGKSLGRKIAVDDEGNLNYLDLDNNRLDFGIQEPTPGKQNENLKPVAKFDFSPENPYVGDNILFDASSSFDPDGNISLFIWDFGDGSSTSTINSKIAKFFSASSTFTISLSVVDDLEATSTPTTTQISVISREPLSIVINEIAWMGTKASSSDEWIEFYNNTDEDIDIINWSIFGAKTENYLNFSEADGKTTTIISSQDYLIYAKRQESVNSDGTSMVDIWDDEIEMDDISPDQLKLYDTPNCQGDLIDVVREENGGWFSGNSSNFISMERISATSSGAVSTNWASNNLITRNGLDVAGNKINGTPKAENSVSKKETIIDLQNFNSLFDEFSEITLIFLGSPYIVTGEIIVPQGKTLIIQPGVTIKFEKEYTFFSAGKVIVEGSLKALGNPDQPITFTDWEGSPGSFWRGIYFTPTSLNSELDYTVIKNAGCSQQFCFSVDAIWIIKVEQSQVLFKNSILENTDSYRGIWLVNSDSTIEGVTFSNFISDFNISQNSKAVFIQGGNPIIRNSTFKKNSYGIEIENGATPLIEVNYFEENEIPIYASDSYPSLSQNQFVNNSSNGILIKGNLSQNTTWKSGITYVVDYYLGVSAGVTLTLEPGVVIKMKRGALTLYYEAYIQILGNLVAEGTLDQPIVFTSLNDDSFPFDGGDTNNDGNLSVPSPWDWREITFFPESSGSLKWVIIRYGGDNRTNNPFTTNNPLVIQEGANVNVDNETVKIEFSSKP